MRTLSPTAHTSLAELPHTRARVRLVGLSTSDHEVPSKCRMRPFWPTAMTLFAAVPQTLNKLPAPGRPVWRLQTPPDDWQATMPVSPTMMTDDPTPHTAL